MTLSEYQKAAARTLLNRPDFELTDDELMTIWCLVGLIGETGELIESMTFANSISYIENHRAWLDRIEKVKNEIGDVLWYLAGICTKQKIDLAKLVEDRSISIKNNKKLNIIKALAISICKISEIIKKGIFHQHGIQRDELQYNIKRLYFILKDISRKYALNIFDIMDANNEKLKKRYPNGYNSQDSKKKADLNAIRENA